MYYSGIKMYHKGIKKSYWYQMGTVVSKCVEKVWKVSQKVWNWFFWYEIEFLGIKWVFSYQIEVFDTFSCRFDTKMGIKKTAVFSWWDLYAASTLGSLLSSGTRHSLLTNRRSLLQWLSTRVHCVPLVSSSIKLFLHILRQLRAAV